MTSPVLTCGILTVSDSCFVDPSKDTSSKELEKAVRKSFSNIQILYKDIVPDDIQPIINKLNEWVRAQCTIILTTGGTGFSPRDVTPEATKAVIEREAPGIAYAMISRSLQITPMAMLSRTVSGIKNKTLIINLPGSAKGAVECFSFIKDCIPHAIALITENRQLVADEHKNIQKKGKCAEELGPSKVRSDNVAERPRQSTYPLVEVEKAVELIMKESTISAETERISIQNALYRVLAEDVLSEEDVPPFDASIKDGYAVIASDGDGPRKVRNAIGAGDAPNLLPLQKGEAVRIGTGAPIPVGADAIVQVEDTTILKAQDGEELEINVNKIPVEGQDIRPSGTDIARNTVVLTRGLRLGAAHIGVLAAIGKSTITVYRRVSVAVFTTGNELKEPHEQINAGQIRDCNRITLINLLKEYHYECQDHNIVKDEPNAIKKAVYAALASNDVLITTGGVSMGEFDFIKRVLVEDFNATVHFGRVNMKPGKPTTFATLTLGGQKKIVFGLPGNPVSACVTSLLFVIPMLRHLEGASDWRFPTIPHTVSTSKENSDPRPEFVRAIVGYVDGKIVSRPNGGQISSRLNSLVGANGLMLMPGSMTPGKEYSSHIILIDSILT